VKGEEDDEVVLLLHQQCINASSDDPSDTPGYTAVFMALLNDHTAWAGNIDDVITLSIHESGRLLADLTCENGKDGPVGTVKEDRADESIYPREQFF
jgi:hypothetical protein